MAIHNTAKRDDSVLDAYADLRGMDYGLPIQFADHIFLYGLVLEHMAPPHTSRARAWPNTTLFQIAFFCQFFDDLSRIGLRIFPQEHDIRCLRWLVRVL